jgi:hypothetical protein
MRRLQFFGAQLSVTGALLYLDDPHGVAPVMVLLGLVLGLIGLCIPEPQSIDTKSASARAADRVRVFPSEA